MIVVIKIIIALLERFPRTNFSQNYMTIMNNHWMLLLMNFKPVSISFSDKINFYYLVYSNFIYCNLVNNKNDGIIEMVNNSLLYTELCDKPIIYIGHIKYHDSRHCQLALVN